MDDAAMRFLPTGPTALLIEVDSLDAVFSLVAEIDRRREAGWGRRVVDVVPGATTVLLDGIDDPAALAGELAAWTVPPVAPSHGPTVEVPCRYGGPDLAAVAAHWGVAEDEVPEIHAALPHRVAFCGFNPGFAYIVGLGDRWRVPRLRTPRSAVPAGSVALADGFTGVYPRRSPGGWQIIGHTGVELWEPTRDPPALLAPGTVVRFLVA